jgi:hypothetical protein
MMFCITHGRGHYPGETEDVTLLGDDLECHEVEWPVVVAGVVTSSVPTREPVDEVYYTLGDNDLAYLDARPGAGLVPVKVLAIEPTEGEPDDEDAEVAWFQADLRVTAARPGFNRGQRIQLSLPNPVLLSRDTVYTLAGQVAVLGPTRIITPEGELL